MTHEHPVVDLYLGVLDDSLKACVEREEIVAEIRHHIADATAAGTPLSAVLEALGPAEALGQAYAVELALHSSGPAPFDRVRRFVSIAAVVAAGSMTTLLVVGGLGSIGIGFVPAGAAIVLIGMLEASAVHLPGVQTRGIAPVWIMLLGVVIVVVGCFALVGLRIYVRFLVRRLRPVLARTRKTSHRPPSVVAM